MARSYSVNGNATNTASSSLPMLTLISSTAVRPKIFSFDISSDATPADNAAKYALQRCTTTGTPGSSITPQYIDSGDSSVSSSTTSGLAIFSVGPTLTSNAFVWQAAINQRATYHWQAAPTKELVMPATSSNGLALMSLVVNSAYNGVFSFTFEE